MIDPHERIDRLLDEMHQRLMADIELTADSHGPECLYSSRNVQEIVISQARVGIPPPPCTCHRSGEPHDAA